MHINHPFLFPCSSATIFINKFPTRHTFHNLSNKPLTEQCNIRKTNNNINFSSSISSTKTKVPFFRTFLTNAKALKLELLEAIEPLDKGVDATLENQNRIDQITSKLEAVNPTKKPLKSDLLNGKWELIYTTAKPHLQPQRPKFLRTASYQAINTDTFRAQGMESWPLFNQVFADLTPVNSRKLVVKFD